MRRIAALFVGLVVASSPGLSAQALVSVTYVQPEKFSDAALYGGYGEKARAPALDGIRQHLERLAQRYLQPGQALRIDVLDLDLAGRFEPWRGPAYDVRYLRDITWPRLTLRYALTQDGAEIARGEETIRDMSYLTRPSRLSSDSLHYEKAMLDDWFRARLLRGLPSRD